MDKLLGAIESPIDLRDYTIKNLVGKATAIEIPDSFKLDYEYDILNQGNVSSCRAFVEKRMRDYIDGMPFEENKCYSSGFIYGYRKDSDFQGEGLVARESLNNLCEFGDCLYESFPINEEYPAIKQTLKKYNLDKLKEEASNHKSIGYIRLYKEDIKEYLVKYKKPVEIMVRVYSNFYKAKTNGGKIPSVPSGNYRGGHALLVIGYNKDELILVNSWGSTYGDNGIFYLDINSKIIREFWALEDIKNIIRPKKITYTIGWNKIVINGKIKWQYSLDGKTVLKSQWIQTAPIKWYYIKDDSYAADGEWILDDGYWYYLQKDSCEMKIGWFKDTNGYWYYLRDKNPAGAMLTGWFTDTDGKVYYLEERNGYNKGHMYCNGIFNINGKFYEFNSSGELIKSY